MTPTRMQDSDWAGCRRLRPLDVADWRKLSRDLIQRVDAWVQLVGPCVISSTVGGDHVSDSQHYLGLAVDITPQAALDRKMTVEAWLNCYLTAERLRFTGIGLYPHWNRPGFHLDLRDESTLAGNAGRGARWWRDDAGSYRALDWAGLAEVNSRVRLALAQPKGV
jgi:hypothetical protein